MAPKNTAENFWARVEKTDGCWEWKGYIERSGYGRFAMNNRMMSAHRVAFMLTYGDIPEGLFVCHHCDNPPCVNPAHLFLGTNSENQRDLYAKGRRNHYGEKNPFARLTEKEVLEIRARYAAGGITQTELGRQYGVSFQLISGIVLGQYWKHILPNE